MVLRKGFVRWVLLTVFFAVSVASAACPVGDLNRDCQVDLHDLALLAEQWLESPDCSGDPCADLDRSGGVNLVDLAILSANWGLKSYPLLINEYMSSNHNTIEDPDEVDEYPDWVELYNFGSKSVNIGGCWVTNDPANLKKYLVPSGDPDKTTILSGGFLLLWMDKDPSQGLTHFDFKLSATTSEFVGLSDPSGHPIDSLDTLPLTEDISYGRTRDGAIDWQIFGPATQSIPTPGTSNGSVEDDGKVMISEIMYHPYNPAHPLAEDIREEYFELYNSGDRPVRLFGWRMTRGVEFTFPDVTIQPKACLAVAADVAVFQAKYLSVTNVVGGWIGHLSNSSETLEVVNTLGRVIDTVPYSDEGDWSFRLLGPVESFGGTWRGWEWSDLTDGQGHSLELKNPAMPNEYGQNWGPSQMVGGTPGQPSSIAKDNIPPLILNVKHVPVIPRPTDLVTVTARILDEQIIGLTANLHYRVDTSTYQGNTIYPTYDAASYSVIQMFDDGIHDDGLANDGVYAVQIPAMADKTIVEFFVEASDAAGLTRKWPAPAQIDGVSQQVTNLLYQVDQTYDPSAVWTAGTQPIYRIIMTEMERGRLDDIGNKGTIDGPDSQMNATFISIDGTGMELRYNLSIRNRGHGTRTMDPMQYHVHFPNDRSWKGVNSTMLNTNYTAVYEIGTAAFEMAGITQPGIVPIQVRVNGQNLAPKDLARTFGSYILDEAVDSDWVAKRFPKDPAGNAYKCMRVSTGDGNLTYLGTNPDSYRGPYTKETNGSIDDWTDLINMTYALSTNTPDSEYVAAVNRVINVEQWLRFLAVNTLVDNREASIGTGRGDEYFMYCGVNDHRFVLIQHDLEDMFGVGDETATSVLTAGIFRPTGVAALNRLMKHPQFAPRYYWHLKNLTDTIFSTPQINRLIDQRLGSWVPAGTIQTMKDYALQVRTYVLSKIPLAISVTTAVNATTKYVHTTTNTVSLTGLANAIDTRRVTLNGLPAVWSAWEAKWTISSVPLLPGVNRVVIQTFDASDKEIDRGSIDVWYNTGSSMAKSGTLTADEVWTAASGPYHVTGMITIPAGRTLTINPGTSVFLDNGAGFIVHGRFVAQGTEYSRIRLTRVPQTTTQWNGFQFPDTKQDNIIAYTDLEFGGGGSHWITTGNDNASAVGPTARLTIDHATFSGADIQIFSIWDPQIIIRNSVFADVDQHYVCMAERMPADGWFIIESNLFGHSHGDTDIFHLNSVSVKGGPAAQIMDNVFTGGGDDIVDDNETDTYIEGNLFMHANVGNSARSASAGVTTGPGGGSASADNLESQHLTVVRNIFYHNDYGILSKTGAYSEIYSNVFIQNAGAILFDEPTRSDSGPGRASYVENCIFWNNGPEVDGTSADNGTGTFVNRQETQLTVNNCIVKGQFIGLGAGNLDVDPQLNDADRELYVDMTLSRFSTGFPGFAEGGYLLNGMIPDVQLLPDSPARGTGNNGVDMGFYVPLTASIGGVPTSPTWKTEATLSVGGTDLYGYKYRISGPGFDNTWSDEQARMMPVTALTRSGLVATATAAGHGFVDGDIIEVLGADRAAFNGMFAVFGVTANTFSYTMPTANDLLHPEHLDIWVRKYQPIELMGLTDGTYTISAIKKNSKGVWQDENQPTTATWTVNTTFSRVIISEVLARNAGILPINGGFPNLIELYYDAPGTTSLDLGGMKVTDGGTTANEFILPAGTQILPGEYKVLYADRDPLTPGIHLGFFLNGEGDAVKLYNAGGELIDSVQFGFQVAGLSIGRLSPDGDWVLCKPTFGFPNVVQPVREPSGLRINEWFANGQVRFSDDFIELNNPASVPVRFDGVSLTDNYYSEPTKFTLPPLSFINAKESLALWSKQGGNANNLNFHLQSENGTIVLLDRDRSFVDGILYSDQTADCSQGRTPDGSDTLAFFRIPTPGKSNPKGATTIYTTTTLIPENAAKKVLVPTAAVAEAWKGGAAFNDSTWNSGTLISGKAGGVGYENNPGDATNFTDLITYDIKLVKTGTCYIRVPFTLTAEQVASVSSLNLKMRRDDAFIAYINGITAAQTDNIPASPAWNSYASAAGPGDSTARKLADYPITNSAVMASLKVGQNILAVHGMDATSSSDMIISFILEIITKHTEGENVMAPYETLADGLRITELMYAPAAGGVEFIELKNVGDASLDLKGVRFLDGIEFEFGHRTLNSGQFVVLTADVAAFQALYGTGVPVVGPYVGALKDRGESVVLALPDYDAAILRFAYDSNWYPSTAGGGHSLVIVNDQLGAETWDHAAYWRASTNVGGFPGSEDPQ